MKLHVVYNPHTDQPLRIEVSPANMNDVTTGRAFPIEPGAAYVFDKGYCDHGWWREARQGRLPLRHPAQAHHAAERLRPSRSASRGRPGFTVLGDEIGHHSSKNGTKLDFALRRLTLATDDGRRLTLITNDLDACALEIGQLYKSRWDIALLFRWIKKPQSKSSARQLEFAYG